MTDRMDNDIAGITEAEYTRFWQDNIQKLEEISANLNDLVNSLESEYAHFEGIYERIETDIDILSSIYAGVNALQGQDYILKLHAVIREYRRRYTRDGINFNLINFLMTKINDLREESVSYFPGLEHEERKTETILTEPPDYSRYYARPFKWITFERNESWFILPFKDVSIFPIELCQAFTREDKDIFSVTMEGRVLRGRDIFAEFYPDIMPPACFIQPGEGTDLYAATRIGKRIFANLDFITPRITSFQHLRHSPLASGRVRLFGRNHIHLSA